MKYNEPIQDRKHFKNFGDFLKMATEKSVTLGFDTWTHGKESENEYFCKVQFKDATIIVFHSKHYLWLKDATRVLTKLEKKQ